MENGGIYAICHLTSSSTSSGWFPSVPLETRSYKSAAGGVSVEGAHHTYTLQWFWKGLSDPCLRPSWYLGITEYKLRSQLAKDGHWVGVREDTWATGEGAKVD